jgi:two-component system, LuxR family, response regulator FixJ
MQQAFFDDRHIFRRHYRDRRCGAASRGLRCAAADALSLRVMAEQTVFIIDDDPLIRSMIELLLRASGRTVASFAAATEFLAGYVPQRAGCLICDICMPGMSGIELQTELNRTGSTLPLIFISARSDIPTAVTAMQRGAFDFLVKPFSNDELLERVAAALGRDEKLRHERHELEQIRARRDSLTPREQDILERMAKGLSNKVMSHDLSLSVRTVELHRARVMEKMGARSIAELVRMILAIERAGPV